MLKDFSFLCSFLFSIFSFSFVFSAKAQSGDYYNVVEKLSTSKFSVGAYGGFTFPHTDVQASERSGSGGAFVSYTVLPYLSLKLDLQTGQLREGYKNVSPHGLKYKNDYFASGVFVQLNPVQLLNTNSNSFLKYLNFHGALGAIAFKSNVKAKNPFQSAWGYTPNYQSMDFLLPIEIGYTVPIYTFYFKQQLSLHVNFRHYYSTSDKLDGYMPTVKTNKSNDVFEQLNFGFTFSF